MLRVIFFRYYRVTTFVFLFSRFPSRVEGLTEVFFVWYLGLRIFVRVTRVRQKYPNEAGAGGRGWYNDPSIPSILSIDQNMIYTFVDMNLWSTSRSVTV